MFAARLDTLTDAPTLILFDIDGTLVLTGGAGGRAMARAFEEAFAVKDAFRGIPMAGRTDASILADALAVHGIPPTTLSRFNDRYLCYLAEELDRPGPGKSVMPGVRDLVDRLELLARKGAVFLALLTGNSREGARAKLQYFDLWRYFPCGAFGDDAPNRHALLVRAIASVSACGGPSFSPRDAVVIGDTPLDVECARIGGARSIAVATGSHGVEQLREAGADVVLNDLRDTERVLSALGVS